MPARKISDGFQKLDVGFRDVDAALSIDRKVFLFKGNLIFFNLKVIKVNKHKKFQFFKLNLFFMLVLLNLGAILFLLSCNPLHFYFLGEYYWRFSLLSTNEYALDYGYPKKIATNWKGLPNSVDAAFTWSNGEIYFFKGNS